MSSIPQLSKPDVRSADGPVHESGAFALRRKSAVWKGDALTFNKLRFHQLPLIGRSRHMEVLQRSVTELFQQDRDGDKSKKKTVRILDLVHGNSGTGKTALAMQAEKYVKKRNGFFISGKFDLQQMDEPYAAIKLALAQLCKNLLAASSTSSEAPEDTFGSSSSFAEGAENQLDAIQGKMQLELDKELCTILVRVMPELRHLVGCNSSRNQTDPNRNSHSVRDSIG